MECFPGTYLRMGIALEGKMRPVQPRLERRGLLLEPLLPLLPLLESRRRSVECVLGVGDSEVSVSEGASHSVRCSSSTAEDGWVECGICWRRDCWSSPGSLGLGVLRPSS